MPKTYRKSNSLVRGLTEEVIEQFHPHLNDHSAIVDLIDAYDTTGGPAVMHHGLPAFAVVRAVPLKDRTMGRGDAEITFDGFLVGNLSEDGQRALIDHELYHLEIKRNKDGQVKYDDLGRVEFKMRPHDREFGWFDSIARRWGRHSQEVRQAMEMIKEEDFRQLYLTDRDKFEFQQVDVNQPAPDQPALVSQDHPADEQAPDHLVSGCQNVNIVWGNNAADEQAPDHLVSELPPSDGVHAVPAIHPDELS